MAWRQQILDYLEKQICSTLMVSNPDKQFENEINTGLDHLMVHNTGDIPVTLESSSVDELEDRFYVPRVPMPCGDGERRNTAIRYFFSRPIDDKNLTGYEANDRVPAVYLQVFGGRQDTGNYGMSTPEAGRLDHQIEYFTFIIHGVFRDRTYDTSLTIPGNADKSWKGNGAIWKRLKDGCQFIPGLPDISGVPNTKWRIKLNQSIGNLLPSEVTVTSNTVIDVDPKCKETEYYDITLQTAVASLSAGDITIARAGISVVSTPPEDAPMAVKYDYWKTINEQVLGFVEDIQSVVSLTHITSIAPEIEGLRQDTFISNTYWGDWAMLPKAENSPVDQVSLPLIIKVHYPKNP